MGKTYDYLPYRLSDVMRQVVSNVSENLASESTLSIPYVSFHAETWLELCDRLKAEAESELSKQTRFPLIALIGNDEYDINDKQPYPEVSCTIIIVTKSDPTWRSENRVAVNYNPILYPIYTELLEQLAASPLFQGVYNPYPSHKCIENYNVSEQGATGGTAYKLNDSVDGLIVTNLKLRLNRPRKATFNYGLTKSLVYLNNVSVIGCSASGNKITVTLDGVNYTDTLHIGHPEYSVCFSHGGGSESIITIGGSVISPNVEQDGEYYGYVQCDDGITISKLYFYYGAYGGVVTKYLSSNLFILGGFLANSIISPNCSFEIETEVSSNKSNIISREYTTDGGSVIFSQPYTPFVNSADDLSTIFTTPIISGYQDVGFNLLIDGPANTSTQLESISYFKIQ